MNLHCYRLKDKNLKTVLKTVLILSDVVKILGKMGRKCRKNVDNLKEVTSANKKHKCYSDHMAEVSFLF